MNGRAGFSLIEALVALIVLSIGLVALFSLQQQITNGQRRYEQALDRAASRRNILAALRMLNPADQPSGAMEMTPGRQLRWTSRPLTTWRRTIGPQNADGAYDAAIYEVTAGWVDGSGVAAQTISFDRVAWRRARPPPP